MSDEERRMRRYSRFVSERPRMVTFGEPNRRQGAEQQRRRPDGFTRHSVSTEGERDRDGSRWRRRGVQRISGRSREEGCRSQQRRWGGEGRVPYQYRRNPGNVGNQSQGRAGHQRQSRREAGQPSQRQSSRNVRTRRITATHRASWSERAQDRRSRTSGQRCNSQRVEHYRSSDSQDQMLRVVPSRRSRTPSPPSRRTIHVTVSTSQGVGEQRQAELREEVNVPASAVTLRSPQEGVKIPEKSAISSQSQPKGSVCHRKLRQQVCPLCNKVVDMVKRHMEKKHLPWFFTPELVCWACAKVQENGAQLWANLANCPGEFSDHRLGLWAVAVWKWLEHLAEFLQLGGLSQLLGKVVQERLYPLSSGNNISPTRKLLMMWLQRAKDTPVKDITIAPPNCVAALLDWQTVTKLLLQLQETEREILASYPLSGGVGGMSLQITSVPVAGGHCHLEGVVQRLGVNQLEDIWQVAAGGPSYLQLQLVIWNRVFPEAWKWPLENVTTPVRVLNTVGVHPRLANQTVPWEVLEVQIRAAECVGVGECGLDETAEDMPAQEILFVRQLRLAQITGKAIVLHIRGQGKSTEIHQRVLGLVSRHLSRRHRIYIHCYSADWDTFVAWSKAFPNLMIGVTTLTTKLPDFLKLGRLIPLSKLAVETDSPYLPPVPYGVNLPQLVHHQAQTLAEVRNLPLCLILEETCRNVHKFFFEMWVKEHAWQPRVHRLWGRIKREVENVNISM